MTSAATRGLLVALLIATPALLLPGVADDSSQITVLMALVAGVLTFIEYNSNSPSIVEFRDAPPFNRLRFVALLITVLLLTGIAHQQLAPTLLSSAIAGLAKLLGDALDFPYSPVRLMVLMLPETASSALVQTLRSAAAVAAVIALVMLLIFAFLVKIMGWPTRQGAFNVWVNLPLFDPTAGGDVIERLQTEARINIALGFLLPFVIPAVAKVAALLVEGLPFDNPQTLIWTASAWAFLPASMVMRGIAMGKVADMIEDKRRRAYEDDDTALQAV